MGLVRKTLSVGTLGVIPYRGKKERLRRAERAQRQAEEALEREQAERAAAEARAGIAEKEVKRTKRHGRHARRAKVLTGLIAEAQPMVRSGIDAARSEGSDAAERGRKVGRRARKAATQSAHDAKKGAKRSARKVHGKAASTKEAVAPHAEHAGAKLGEAIDHLTTR